MALPDLTVIVEKGLLLWLAAMAAIVAWRCLTGQINLSGMLVNSGGAEGDGAPAPERVQMLLGFLFGLAAYIRFALTHSTSGTLPPSLPDVSQEFVALFAASHSIYLGGKTWRLPKT